MPPTVRRTRLAWVVLVCACAIVALAFGTRHSFGLFMRPITADLGWGRESLSLVFALQALLNGLAAPFAGAISDRWGVGRTVLGGGVIYASGLFLMAQSSSPAAMILSGGLLVGMGVSACGMPVLLSAVARVASEEKRSLWLGFVAAGATAGQLLIIPFAQWAISRYGWSTTLMILAASFVALLPLAAMMDSAIKGSQPHRPTQSLSGALAEARTHSGYLLLTMGFFVCGFQVQFIASHLPAFIEDHGFTAGFAAASLVVIAAFNMVGTWMCGYLGGKYSKKYLLTVIYLFRAVIITIFVSLPVSSTSVLVFCASIGFTWLGTVPLTSGLVAQIFGTRYMATLFAVVYLSHQLGNFAGAWTGGRVFDMTGSYELVWWLAAVLSVIAAALHYPIRDTPLPRAAAA